MAERVLTSGRSTGAAGPAAPARAAPLGPPRRSSASAGCRRSTRRRLLRPLVAAGGLRPRRADRGARAPLASSRARSCGSTIHMVSPRDYRPLAAPCATPAASWWLRAHRRRRARGDGRGARSARARSTAGRSGAQSSTRRLGSRPPGRDPPVGRPAARAAVGDVGAAPRRPLRRRRRLARPARSPPRTPAIEHLVRRYLAAFGPARRARHRRLGRPAPGGGRGGRCERIAPRRFRDEHGGGAPRPARAPIPDAETPRRSGSCPPGTRRCSCTPGAPGSCRSGSGRSSSTRRRPSRCRRSWSTAGSRARGGTGRPGGDEPFAPLPRGRCARSRPRRSAWPPSWPEGRLRRCARAAPGSPPSGRRPAAGRGRGRAPRTAGRGGPRRCAGWRRGRRGTAAGRSRARRPRGG